MALVFPSSLFLEDQRLKGSKDDIMLSQWHNSCPSQDSNPPSMHLRYYYPSLLPVCWNQASTLNISSMDHAIFHGIIQPFEEYIFLALMASHCGKQKHILLHVIKYIKECLQCMPITRDNLQTVSKQKSVILANVTQRLIAWDHVTLFTGSNTIQDSIWQARSRTEHHVPLFQVKVMMIYSAHTLWHRVFGSWLCTCQCVGADPEPYSEEFLSLFANSGFRALPQFRGGIVIYSATSWLGVLITMGA